MSDEALRAAAASIARSAESFRDTAGFIDETARMFLERLELLLEVDRATREANK